MFIVFEMQTDLEGHTACLPPVAFENLNDAESKYHMVLAYAAISDVPYHTALLCHHNGNPLMYHCYEHIPEPEPVIEEPTEEPVDVEEPTNEEPIATEEELGVEEETEYEYPIGET